MGMDIIAIVFGVAAIGLGGYFFIKETFGKDDSDKDELSADSQDETTDKQ